MTGLNPRSVQIAFNSAIAAVREAVRKARPQLLEPVMKVEVDAPLAELRGYANAIRSLSRERASYSMTPSHFERLPDSLALKAVSDSGVKSVLTSWYRQTPPRL